MEAKNADETAEAKLQGYVRYLFTSIPLTLSAQEKQHKTAIEQAAAATHFTRGEALYGEDRAGWPADVDQASPRLHLPAAPVDVALGVLAQAPAARSPVAQSFHDRLRESVGTPGDTHPKTTLELTPLRQAKAVVGAIMGPDGPVSLVNPQKWRHRGSAEIGARLGVVGDFAYGAVGVLGAIANPAIAAGELARLSFTFAGVTGGSTQDAFGGRNRTEDPEADERGVLGRLVRPMQYPDRAGFALFMPAALGLIVNGAVRAATSPVPGTGMADIVGGLSLAAGFAAVMVLDDPHSKAERQSLALSQMNTLDWVNAGKDQLAGGLRRVGRALGGGEQGDEGQALPDGAPPDGIHFKRAGARLGRVGMAIERFADRLEQAEIGRFQVYSAMAAVSTVAGVAATVDRWANAITTGAVLDYAAAGLQTLGAAAMTGANIAFGMASSRAKPAPEPAAAEQTVVHTLAPETAGPAAIRRRRAAST